MSGGLLTLFSNYAEIHTAQLGALLGLFVGILYRDRPTLACMLLVFGVLSAFGHSPHVGFVLYSDVSTLIGTKPWYFLSALYVSTAGNLLVLEYGPTLGRRLVNPPKPRTDDVVGADDGS